MQAKGGVVGGLETLSGRGGPVGQVNGTTAPVLGTQSQKPAEDPEAVKRREDLRRAAAEAAARRMKTVGAVDGGKVGGVAQTPSTTVQVPGAGFADFARFAPPRTPMPVPSLSPSPSAPPATRSSPLPASISPRPSLVGPPTTAPTHTRFSPQVPSGLLIDVGDAGSDGSRSGTPSTPAASGPPSPTTVSFPARYFRLRVPHDDPPAPILRRFARLRAAAMAAEPYPRNPPVPGPDSPHWHPSLLSGVWVSTSRRRDPGFVYVRAVESGREVWAFKLTGNNNVPRGKLSWRAFVDDDGIGAPSMGVEDEVEEDAETPWGLTGGAPINRIVGTVGGSTAVSWINVPGVVRRYVCKKQFAHPGYKNPSFSDGELLVISNDELCVYSYKHHHITRYMRMPEA
ncbi:hypothetical protein M427DRAFT_160828 [Gonapodya prolifera JEL478]|uniref:Uncharacterized protein n=1 Tax=Gonapodya prolifera (strain JEL478) TaxID=1344416 RepID=A0A138ZXN0_GONPJ|nr:hypothetical protein M427DRAFT_160828 [Gonapodya prolifera JEL478]|eukprot:KXS09256.1 hypothetical protein M427DRAFT_160828 [Gonapodya prolifera JEL478]